MKVRIVNVGKAVVEAEERLQFILDELKNCDIKFISDTGFRVIVVYEEKESLKGLTRNDDNGNIESIRKTTKVVKDETARITNNRTRSKKPIKNKGNQ